jgi:puromycin-sensitive aminopeptidase
MKRICLWSACIFLLSTFLAAQRLPELAVPESYKLTFTPDFGKDNFTGDETIQIRVLKSTAAIVLNSADLEFQEASITSAGTTQNAKVTFEEGKEQATLSVEKPLAPGPATIQTRYTGTLNDEMRGLYLGKDDQGRKYAATQFESTDARRAYPSFDEPAYKATFDVTAIVPQGMVAISNSKIVSDTPGPGEGRHTVHFATTPKISSYLVALIVGHFEYVEGEADGIPIRVWSTPGKKDLGTFALEVAEDALKYYDNYFQIKYPYGKLDLVGLPDFSAGAMENVGCITFRELDLLLDAQHSAMELRDEVAGTITHEMAHQWFGDLVTMEWWNDIWLNEGFATWMASKPLEAFKPEWHEELSDVRDAARAQDADSLENTRPIRQSAETPAQILELFDEIAYSKAAAVLRMLEAYAGPETFRAGANEYLKEHAYGNAVAADFWNAEANVSHRPVDKIMPTFVDLPGVPFVGVKTECSGNSTRVTLQQQRYFFDRARFNAGSSELWQIPVCLKAEAGGKTVNKCELLTRKEESFVLPGCASWVLGNANATGYYHSGYQTEALKALAQDAEGVLTPAERIMLLADTWASVRVGRESIGDYLTLAEGLRQDHNPAVMEQLLGRLDGIGQYLVSDRDRAAYQDWLRNLLAPNLKQLGPEPSPSDTDEQRTLRAHLMSTLGRTAQDPEVLAEAHKLTEQSLQRPGSVDDELEFTVFRLAALNGDAALYDQISDKLKHAQTPAEQYLYQSSLSMFSDPALVERTLEYAISPEVRSQDALIVIARVMLNPSSQKAAWDFVRSHWPEVEKAGGPFASAEIVGVAGSFCSSAMEDEVKQFFTAHPVAAADRTLKQTLERIDYCADLKAQQSAQLSAWLGQRSGTRGR